MIEIRELEFHYDKEQAPTLKGINLDIHEGEWVTILGRNGSGKSALARLMNGLLLPSAGQVIVDGLTTTEPEQLWQIREKVSFVFQNPENQFIATSVEDDIAFGPENLGYPREEITSRVERALELMHLKNIRDKAPHLLSGGEKQRVALAGALAMASQYLVMDEPTSMLDPQMRRTVLDSLRFLHDELGMAIIYITNIMEEALLGERIVVLQQGTIARQGTPAEIFADQEWLLSMGLDLPQISQLAGMLTQAGYKQFAGIIDSKQLMEKILCAK